MFLSAQLLFSCLAKPLRATDNFQGGRKPRVLSYLRHLISGVEKGGGSGVVRIWCEEGHENNIKELRVTHNTR